MEVRKGRGHGEDAASPRRIEAAEKRQRALELRKAGATYDKIAQQVGYSNRGNAQRAVQTALREVTADPAREVIAIELERLDAMLLGLWGQARTGHLGSIDRVLRIQERRASYLGLDHDTQKPATEPVIVLPGERSARLRALLEKYEDTNESHG